MKNLKIIFVLVLGFCLFSLSANAAKLGFVSDYLQDVQKMVQKKYGEAVLLQRVSDLRSYKDWPADLDHRLKLLVAVKWMEQGYLGEASAVLDQIDSVTVPPDVITYYRASIHLAQNSITEAEPLLTDLSARYSDDQDFLFLKSSFFALQQNFAAAINALTETLKKRKHFGRAYLQRGLLYLLALSHEQAIEDLELAAKYLPEDDVKHKQIAYLQIALIHIKVNFNQTKAKPFIEKALDLDPNSKIVKQFYEQIQSSE